MREKKLSMRLADAFAYKRATYWWRDRCRETQTLLNEAVQVSRTQAANFAAMKHRAEAAEAKLQAAEAEVERLMGKWSDHKAELVEMHKQRQRITAERDAAVAAREAAEEALREIYNGLVEINPNNHDEDDVFTQNNSVIEAIQIADAILAGHAPAPEKPKHERIWVGPGQLESTGYIDPPATERGKAMSELSKCICGRLPATDTWRSGYDARMSHTRMSCSCGILGPWCETESEAAAAWNALPRTIHPAPSNHLADPRKMVSERERCDTCPHGPDTCDRAECPNWGLETKEQILTREANRPLNDEEHAIVDAGYERGKAILAEVRAEDRERKYMEALASYANDEDRYNRGDGEPYGSIALEVGAIARQARAALSTAPTPRKVRIA